MTIGRLTTGRLLAVLYLASGVGTVEMHELPPSCHTDGSCVADDAMLMQVARIRDQETRHTAQVVSKLEDLANKVIDGTEKITPATKEALETIDDEMDSIISHAEQNQIDFQASVDRAKQAIEACGTTTSTAHTKAGGVDDLAAAVSTARNAHNTCRTSESNLKQDKSKECTEFNLYVADLKMPSCSCSTADSLGVVGFKNCIAEMATWSSTAQTTWAEKEKLCDDATSAHDVERTSCNTKQGSLESDFCSYNTALSMTCSTQESCRAKEIALREEEHASVAVSESAFKAEYESANHVKCILKVLNATDEVKRGMLAACTSVKVDTEHLSVKYPEVPDLAPCDLTPVANKPCDQEWTDEEFQGKTWLTNAPLNNCVPCPAVGGTTTATPTTATPTTATPTNAPTVATTQAQVSPVASVATVPSVFEVDASDWQEGGVWASADGNHASTPTSTVKKATIDGVQAALFNSDQSFADWGSFKWGTDVYAESSLELFLYVNSYPTTLNWFAGAMPVTHCMRYILLKDTRVRGAAPSCMGVGGIEGDVISELPLKKWMQVVAVYKNDGSEYLVVDGQKTATVRESGGSTTNKYFRLGCPIGNHHTDAYASVARIYGKALGEDEIKASRDAFFSKKAGNR